MSLKSRPDLEQVERAAAFDALGLSRNLVRILFVHRFPAEIEHCLYELKKVRFTVSSDIAVTPEQFAERLRAKPFDLVVAEHPSPNLQETQALDILREMKKDIPVIFLVYGLKRETAAKFILKGVSDCVEMDRISHLPVAVHRALDEKALRDQRDRAEKDLRRSEARYRALAGNLSYGICRCGLDGSFLEVNEAMIRMLGYESKGEVLVLGLVREIIQDPPRRAQLLGHSGTNSQVDPIEMEWRRKDQTNLKVRLSGREVLSEKGELEAYEIIAEDVTRQREVEDHLRRLAASDSLTGLANSRHLVDVLASEIKRSNRTNRQFALLFFDMDGLKRIMTATATWSAARRSAGWPTFWSPAAEASIRRLASAETSSPWSCRKLTRTKPTWSHDVSAKELPTMATGRPFPSAQVLPYFLKMARQSRSSCARPIRRSTP